MYKSKFFILPIIFLFCFFIVMQNAEALTFPGNVRETIERILNTILYPNQKPTTITPIIKVNNPVTKTNDPVNNGTGACTQAAIENRTGNCGTQASPLQNTQITAVQKVQDQVYETTPAFQQQQTDAQNQTKSQQPQTAPGNQAANTDNQNQNGQFVCTGNKGGSLSGGGSDCKPESQGGKIKDELYNSVKNAAEISGVKVTMISCFRKGATIAGTDKISKHASGEALDVTMDSGTSVRKELFILAVLANSNKFNSIGSYGASKHTHIGADKGNLWTSFSTGENSFPEQFKINAFFRAKTTHFNKGKSKVEVSEAAKEALKRDCGGTQTSLP